MSTALFEKKDLRNMEQRYRAAFINSLGGFKSLVLVGTRNREGNTNLALFSSLFHLGANPPLFGLIFRPATVERHSLSNILETRVFTVNHVNETFYEAAHQSSARYPAEISEFNATGLEEEYKTGFYPPFVKQSRIKFGAAFRQKIDIEQNGTTLIIAEIQHVYLPEDCLLPDGFIDLEAAGTITVSGLDSYHKTEKLARLSYAKANQWPQPIGEGVMI